MRLAPIIFTVLALATANAHEPASSLIRPEDIVGVRAIGSEVEIRASARDPGDGPNIGTGFAFPIPVEFGHDFYISSAARSSEGLTLRIKFKDPPTATAFAKFLDEKRSRI